MTKTIFLVAYYKNHFFVVVVVVSPRKNKVSDEMKNQKDEWKKKQEKVKALVNRIAAEIERSSCSSGWYRTICCLVPQLKHRHAMRA